MITPGALIAMGLAIDIDIPDKYRKCLDELRRLLSGENNFYVAARVGLEVQVVFAESTR